MNWEGWSAFAAFAITSFVRESATIHGRRFTRTADPGFHPWRSGGLASHELRTVSVSHRWPSQTRKRLPALSRLLFCTADTVSIRKESNMYPDETVGYCVRSADSLVAQRGLRLTYETSAPNCSFARRGPGPAHDAQHSGQRHRYTPRGGSIEVRSVYTGACVSWQYQIQEWVFHQSYNRESLNASSR
jgi:hypothetical protein